MNDHRRKDVPAEVAASIQASGDVREVIVISESPFGRKVVSCRGTREREKTIGQKGMPV